MNESDFHSLADAELAVLSDALEIADGEGALELESESGVMTIELPGGKQWVVSKHAPTRQLWLSSPVSGGLHFGYDGAWKLPDGRILRELLAQELGVAI